MMGRVDRFPMPLVRLIGTLEALGAAGMILPPLTGIASWLAIAAAIGLVLIRAGAWWPTYLAARPGGPASTSPCR